MQANTRMTLTEYIPDYKIKPEDYIPFIGKKRLDELKKLTLPLRGKGWVNVNSTSVGGGVAEILKGAIPLARSLGVDANWYVIKGSDNFFSVTKKFHNMLQGVDQPIRLEEIFEAYLDTIDENTRNMFIASDLVMIHDPQPAAMVMNGVFFGNVLWRCHIDTSSPNNIIWRFLLPYINQCAGAVFTMPEFMGSGLHIPVYQITPCIDPLYEKNQHYSDSEALDVLGPLFNAHNIDPGRPILAAISRYDIHKNQATIIKAFKQLRRKKKHNPPPYLIFLGYTDEDDPEGGEMLRKLQDMTMDDRDIHLWVNVENNDRVLGALMHLAKAFIHVSTREGFGLVVTEAMWQSTPVIGSNVGGIKLQVIDGETGYLVDPLDVTAIARYMDRLLENTEEAVTIGKKAQKYVRDNFLLPELIRRYFILLRYYTHIDIKTPDFRLNDLTYNEVINTIRPRPIYLSND
ncbi:MAG: glycosyltransferase [Candidatus Latescibacteria bacterium]|nr:glycosyltransferase [Candidatus Latescibacterota bacterium]